MYRSQFPDAPNLFTNVRRPFRPDLTTEISRNFLVVAIGAVLVISGVFIVISNESRAVTTARSLDEGQQKILVPETIDVVFEENNGKLVLVSGPLIIDDPLEDPTYGITIRAVKLKKRVQMYQWYETADQKEVADAVHEGDHDAHVVTSYSYARGWFDDRVNSESFENPMGHHNPEQMPFNATLVVNERVKIGGFLLGKQLKAKFKEYVTFTSDERPEDPAIKMHGGLYFHAKDVWQPEVGDVRVHFSYAGKNGDFMTVVGKQSGREIRPFVAESGEELLFLHAGPRKPEEVFHHEHAQNRVQTWLYRLFSWFLLFIGFNCLSCLLELIIDDNPQIRLVLALGVTSLPFSFAMSTWMICLGISWIIFKPLIGVCMVSMAVFPSFLAYRRIQQRREAEWRRRL